MRALVTGSAGFVGRHMVAELADRGWDVVGVDLVDGTDALAVFRHDATVFDLVAHAAAQAPHRAAIDRRPATMAYNLMLDAAMFDWAVRTGQRRVLYLSSCAAYPAHLQVGDWRTSSPMREDDIALDGDQVGRPADGYGWTKLTGEQMAAAAARSGLAVHVVRPFSGYGEDQGLDFPFGAFVDRARRREDPFTIWGSGHQIRDWIHIDDVVAGALAVVAADERRPVNLCTGVGWTMVELASRICVAAGYDPVFEVAPDAPAGVRYRVGDPTRLHELYTPTISIEQGVKRALA